MKKEYQLEAVQMALLELPDFEKYDTNDDVQLRLLVHVGFFIMFIKEKDLAYKFVDFAREKGFPDD